MPLILHRTWLSTAMLACFPARPLLVRLQIKQSLPAGPFPTRPGFTQAPLSHPLASLPKQAAAIAIPTH
jgi:hypothetical protein